uniref:Putative ovule protein n=1 Tax=Solanum chacoense TaxID=4108 RepID=A0A0V0H576_SOLCH
MNRPRLFGSLYKPLLKPTILLKYMDLRITHKFPFVAANGRSTIGSLWLKKAKKEEDVISKGGQVLLVGNNWKGILKMLSGCACNGRGKVGVGFWGCLGLKKGTRS